MSEAVTIALRIRLNPNSQDSLGLSYITDSLGECARDLEAHEADASEPVLGLVPDTSDTSDPGRYAWEIVVESYPGP